MVGDFRLPELIHREDEPAALEAELGPEEAESRVFDLLDQAWDLLNADHLVRDGYYAFVCEKCAPAFSYYGYFMEAEELERRSKELYEQG